MFTLHVTRIHLTACLSFYVSHKALARVHPWQCICFALLRGSWRAASAVTGLFPSLDPAATSDLFWRITQSVVSPSTFNVCHCFASGALLHVSSLRDVTSDKRSRNLWTVFSKCLTPIAGYFKTPFPFQKFVLLGCLSSFVLAFHAHLCMAAFWTVSALFNCDPAQWGQAAATDTAYVSVAVP